MPNRILREGIITSERVNALSWAAEVFYRRLMSAVDDYGRYWSKAELLRAGLYPLLLDRVGNPDVAKWLTECVNAGLVRTYTVEGKDYLQLLDFRQQVRAAKSKFPEPSSASLADAKQLRINGKASAHLDGDGDGDDLREDAESVLTYLNEKARKEYRPVPANITLITARLKEGASVEDCKAVVERKCAEWGGGDMEKFLRPATLFNATKFAQYQGEKAVSSTPQVAL